MGAYGKAYTLLYLIGAVTILTSCVKDDLYDTPHPDRGAVVVTTDWSGKSTEADIPQAYTLRIGGREQNVSAATNVFDALLAPGGYGLTVYNSPEGISIDGNKATVNPVDLTGAIEPHPGYLFASYQDISVVADDTLHVTAPMRQYVRRLDIELTATEGDYSRVQSATATLSGVASAADMATGDRSVAAQVTNAFRQDDNKFTIFFRLLGIVPTETHTLTVDITFNNGDTQRVVSDLTEAIRDFNNGTNADFTPMTAGGGIFFEDAFLEFTFAAYAPYASGANASTLPGTDGKITVNTSNQPTTTEQEKVDYIHATGAKADKDSPTVSFTDNTAAGGSDCSFKHKMARLILKVQVSNTDGFDDTAVLEFADYKLGGLVHEGTFDVKTGTAATAGSVVSDWMLRQCTGAPKTATDKCVATFDAATGVMTFTMILLPQTLANALVLEISPDDGEYQSYSNKDMIKPALEAGYSYTYTITVKKTGLTLSGSTIENWNDGGSHAGDAKM